MVKLRRVLSCVLILALITGALPVFADAPSVKRLSIRTLSKELVAGKDGFSAMLMMVKAAPEGADLSGLTWTSSKPHVASVDESGYVTAISGGSVKITVKDNDTNKKASKKIRIWVLPTGISMRHTEKTLRAGRSATLSVKLVPSSNIRKADKALSWFSSDASVATVNARGRVKAIAPGEAVITVMTVNGRIDACKVTVTR